jgi:hypothetical protein
MGMLKYWKGKISAIPHASKLVTGILAKMVRNERFQPDVGSIFNTPELHYSVIP